MKVALNIDYRLSFSVSKQYFNFIFKSANQGKTNHQKTYALPFKLPSHIKIACVIDRIGVHGQFAQIPHISGLKNENIEILIRIETSSTEFLLWKTICRGRDASSPKQIHCLLKS